MTIAKAGAQECGIWGSQSTAGAGDGEQHSEGPGLCWGRSGSGGGGLALADMVGHLDVGALWRGAGSQWGRHHRDKGPPPTCPVASLLARRGGTINLRLEQLKRSRTGVTELFESVSAAEGPALSP